MKAEHRKELHTNALADGMGRLVTRLKTRPQKSSVWFWLLAIVAIVVVVAFVWIQQSRTRLRSELWVRVDLLNDPYVQEFKTTYPNTNPGYAARFQVAYLHLWEQGIKLMGADLPTAAHNIQAAQGEYSVLANEVKDDFPTLASEAFYCMTVAQESLTISAFEQPEHRIKIGLLQFGDLDPQKAIEHLKQTQAAYEKVATDYEKTAHGEQAKARADLLKADLSADEGRQSKVLRFYGDLYVEMLRHRPEQERELLQKHMDEMLKKHKLK